MEIEYKDRFNYCWICGTYAPTPAIITDYDEHEWFLLIPIQRYYAGKARWEWSPEDMWDYLKGASRFCICNLCKGALQNQEDKARWVLRYPPFSVRRRRDNYLASFHKLDHNARNCLKCLHPMGNLPFECV